MSLPRSSTRNALVVSLYGGPNVGKTTAAARLFVALKRRHVDCELLDEVARQCIQAGQLGALEVQPYLFGLSLYRLRQTVASTDVVILDSPLLLNPIYDRRQSAPLRDLVLEEYRRFRNLDILLERDPLFPHSMVGRVHDRRQSEDLDQRIASFLTTFGVRFDRMGHDEASMDALAERIVGLIAAGPTGSSAEGR